MNQIFANNAKSTLSNVVGAGDLLIPVVDPSSFPVITGTDFMVVTLEVAGLLEIIKIVAPGKTGNNLIVDVAGRGFEGTTPLSFPVGARVEGRITAGTLNTIVNNAASATSTEASTRGAADTVLQNNITAEALSRANADTTLQTNINNEASARASADTTLQTNINTEASTRASADTTLQTNINNEATARTNADNAINATLNSMLGAIAYFPTATAPTGWFKANGAAVSRTTYSALFGIIGVTFGAGDGVTTFNIPDLRGEFIRGWDDARGVDTGRGLGTAQAEDIKSHTHTYGMAVYGGTSNDLTGNNPNNAGRNTSSTGATGGTETRPRNVALLACIKY